MLASAPLPSISRLLTFALLAFVLLRAAAAAAAAAPEQVVAREVEQLLAVDALRIDGRRLPAKALRRTYADQAYRPLWGLGTDGRRRAEQLIEVLSRAKVEGLDPGDYAFGALTQRLETEDPRGLAERDLLITHELLHYAGDLRSGRAAARRANPELFVHAGKIDRQAVLDGARRARDLAGYLDRLAPANPIYRGLRRQLAAYRTIARRGGWPALPRGRDLEFGMEERRVAVLRERLSITGDLDAEGDGSEVFGDRLIGAVERFQRRHSLEVDGVVGPATRRALNLPVAQRIAQILLNMERWRWMPDELGRRYILVNLAGFDLKVVSEGWSVLEMRVVVGRPYRKTPIFSSRMSYLVFNPTWTVPSSIAGADLLPILRRDPDYLARNRFRVLDGRGARDLDPATIDWSRVSAERFPYTLRQDPGLDNALGIVKFMMPNGFSVYLHDTPQQQLFARRTRTFSSGCIRLEKPMELAAYLLKDDPAWTPLRIDDVIYSGETTEVPLSRPIPIHMTYSTAWVDPDGTLHFGADPYERDRLLHRALFRAGGGKARS